MRKKTLLIEGDIVGIDFRERENDGHIMLDIYIQDDEVWYKELSLSSAWIDDLEEVIKKTKEMLKKDYYIDKDDNGYEEGYSFVNKNNK